MTQLDKARQEIMQRTFAIQRCQFIIAFQDEEHDNDSITEDWIQKIISKHFPK